MGHLAIFVCVLCNIVWNKKTTPGHWPEGFYYTPGFNKIERGVYWFHIVRPSVCPSVPLSVHPSVDGIMSALYLPQTWNWLDLFHFYTSFQPTLEGVSLWFLGIFLRMHHRNGLKLSVLIYPDYLWSWLHFGHDLLIFLILAAFNLVRQVKFVVSRHFLEDMLEELAETWGTDVSWPPLELITFWSWSVDFSQGCTKLKSAWGLNFNINFRPDFHAILMLSGKAQNAHFILSKTYIGLKMRTVYFYHTEMNKKIIFW